MRKIHYKRKIKIKKIQTKNKLNKICNSLRTLIVFKAQNQENK
jgi:hypothetical protein